MITPHTYIAMNAIITAINIIIITREKVIISQHISHKLNMAESLSSFKEQFDDQLTCGVCLDQYTVPKMLPCYHTFCLECIQRLPIIKKV